MLIKMVQLSPLTDQRRRRNKEKREEKIRSTDSITKAAPKWSQGRPEMESGGLIFSSCFSSFLLILSSVRGESCTILTSIKSCFRQDEHAELVNYPFKCLSMFQCFVLMTNQIATLFLVVFRRPAMVSLAAAGKAAE